MGLPRGEANPVNKVSLDAQPECSALRVEPARDQLHCVKVNQ